MTRRFIVLLAAWLAVTLSPPVFAQPSGALGDDFIHRILPGDTLIGLANRYTRNDANWTVLQRNNGISDPQRLVIGSSLRIPFSMIPEVPRPATVVHVSGRAELDGVSLRAGMPVDEGSTITTASDGFVTLQLADGTRLTLPRGGTTQMERLREFEGVPLTDSILRVNQGSIDAEVAPDGQGVGRFEIRTPVAIVGVRGTRFRVHAAENGSGSEVLEGQVALQNESWGKPLALSSGHGVAVQADGTYQVLPLLPAPQVGPAQRIGSGQWTAPVSAVTGAVAYLVQVSRDAAGLKLTSSRRFDDVDIRFSAQRPGTHYVSIRAINAAGLGGRDTYLSFEGVNALTSASGEPVALSDGGVVTLHDYEEDCSEQPCG